MLEGTLELQAGDRVLKDVLMRYPPGEGRLASAREELRAVFERTLERAREQGTLRADFALSDLALALWSFGPLIDATAEVAPNAWRRHLHWLLDGLRADCGNATVRGAALGRAAPRGDAGAQGTPARPLLSEPLGSAPDRRPASARGA